MQLTKEQIDIINSTGNIKINAVAGSGKTTTVIEYARTRPVGSRILYLAFNRSVKREAEKKFAEKGLRNVKVETAHSLAYKHVVFSHGYRVRAQGYKTNEIADLLHLQATGEKHAEYIVANHVNKFITYFCNSDKPKVQDLNYLDVVSDTKARAFVATFYEYIQNQARLLLSKMDKGEIEVTHDFYLKKFQLSAPQLYYDYILFDEGQDASPAMLDIFLKQKAVKVIVGDTHQQIYGWRYAVNSLEKTGFTDYYLSASFRFCQDIANLAMRVLGMKERLGTYRKIEITGQGTGKNFKTKAVLARTNLGLLLKAIQYITEKDKIKHIYFEGNIHSYTYADEGASLYDVLNLYNGRHTMIKDKLIQAMKNMQELDDYIEKTEDVQLGMMVEVVREYGNEIPGLIKALKDKHVADDEKGQAEVVFSTVHRCKGMEYDAVQLVNDFLTEEKLEKLFAEKKKEDINLQKLNEEINLLYVAVTRTKNILYIPEAIVPPGVLASLHIHVIEVAKTEEREEIEISHKKSFPDVNKIQALKEKFPLPEDKKEVSQQANQPWNEELDQELTVMFCEGSTIKTMADHFKRSKGSIKSRIKKLELRELYK